MMNGIKDGYKIDPLGELLRANRYGGRGIVIGKSADGKKAVFAYFIMGRSENSRNRIFLEKGDEVVIHAYDPAKLADPTLIIYSPVKQYRNHTIVTNGDQTDTVYEFLSKGKSFEEALETREFEPDMPNLTPRISGILTFNEGDFSYKMNILKSGTPDGRVCSRYTFSYTPVPGLGHYLHTYQCDGSPIPTFWGEPERVAISDEIDSFTSEIWNSLDVENKVSLYVRFIDLADGSTESRLINKHQQAAR